MLTARKVTTSIWKNLTTAEAHEGAGTRDVCPHCGVKNTVLRSSLREMVFDILCAALLFALLIPVWCVAEHWLEDQSHRVLDRMGWHEPL